MFCVPRVILWEGYVTLLSCRGRYTRRFLFLTLQKSKSKTIKPLTLCVKMSFFVWGIILVIHRSDVPMLLIYLNTPP